MTLASGREVDPSDEPCAGKPQYERRRDRVGEETDGQFRLPQRERQPGRRSSPRVPVRAGGSGGRRQVARAASLFEPQAPGRCSSRRAGLPDQLSACRRMGGRRDFQNVDEVAETVRNALSRQLRCSESHVDA